MNVIARYLRWRADQYRALGEEHTETEQGRAYYQVVELVLREVANAHEATDVADPFEERSAA